jgi:uncharacterized membrane protein YhaH (DUF805 family)
MNLGQLFFGFKGRINRAKYWLTFVVYIAVMIVVTGLAFRFGKVTMFFLIAVVLYLPVAISGVLVGIKRLHDRDKSGWWLLVFYLLPAILRWLAEATGPYAIFELASIAILIWGLVELGVLRGTPGSNQYGPDPLAR